MKALTLTFWLCFTAMPVFAAPTPVPSPCASTACVRGAPAPAIGLGIPVALSVGGVLLGMKLLKRRRKADSQVPKAG
jgi:hypothetical protein